MTSLRGSERNGADRGAALRVPVFVGREQEMTALGEALAAPSALVWIEGEAGIGKSRLLREYLASPAGQASRVLMTCCPPLRNPHTLGPIVDAVRQVADRVANLPLSPLAGALRPLFPEWAGELPPALESGQDATAVRHSVFRALAELLGCLRVAVLAVEDAHWADEATLEFLLFLATAVPQPVRLVVTCRPEDVPGGSLLRRLATRLAADSASVARLRLSLEPLDVDSTAELMSSMLAGEEISPGFAGFVHQRTEGVPLAVEGFVRLMADRADLNFRDGGWDRRHLDQIGVPVTVRDMVLERMERLGADAQAVLQAVAVLRGPAGEATLRAVTGLAAERVHAGLCEALGGGLIDDDGREDGDGRGLVAFRHVLACQAVYGTIASPRRRLLHGRAGRALEVVAPRPVAELAEHFRQAGEQDAWCRYGEQAAGLALASGDEATAGALLYDLVVYADLPATSVVRLVKKLPFASFGGTAHYRGLERRLRAILDSGTLRLAEAADIRAQLGNLLLLMGEDEAGRAELELAIPHLGHNPAEAATAMMRLAWPRCSTWPVAAHLRWLRRASELVVPSMSPADRLRCAADQVTARLMLGQPDGWAYAARIPDSASVPAEREQVARANVNLGDMAMLWGHYAVAGRRLARALALAERHQYLQYRSAALVTRAHLDWLTGAWDGLAERAAALASPDDDVHPLVRLEALLITGLLQAAASAPGRAAQRLRRVLAEETGMGALADSMEAAAALSRLALAGGDAAEALAVTEQPYRIVAGKGTWIWAADLGPARMAALTAVGRVDDAEKLTAAFARGVRGCDAPAPQAGLATCRAILAEARGQYPSAVALFACAAMAWQALPRPYAALLVQERSAGCLIASGRTGDALSLLADVRERLIALGAIRDADRVVATLRAHGVAAKSPQRGGWRGYGQRLSPRELEVTRLVAAGHSNRQIAAALFLSTRTVDRHLSNAMRKLDVSSRTALAMRATGGVELGAVDRRTVFESLKIG